MALAWAYGEGLESDFQSGPGRVTPFFNQPDEAFRVPRCLM
ncbi:hypothetical protein A176_007553 [Myxococcus hansupus]|uniref:Uncharacterized protein n=1 Tax=Pseudomyxococcus hansupus TaxID=1297742 RepID=A0A0H4X4L7_9BACT|nr:hypothetical protein A176_007553 [Myxococcus hansupus]